MAILFGYLTQNNSDAHKAIVELQSEGGVCYGNTEISCGENETIQRHRPVILTWDFFLCLVFSKRTKYFTKAKCFRFFKNL